MLKILFSLHRICIKHVRRWGTSTRQAFLTPSVLRKACPKMGYSHQASFFHTIGFEKASERMGPGHLNHPHKLSHTIGFEKASERMGPARKAPAHEGPGSSTPKTRLSRRKFLYMRNFRPLTPPCVPFGTRRFNQLNKRLAFRRSSLPLRLIQSGLVSLL